MGFHPVGQGVQYFVQPLGLARLHQPEMAFRQDHARVARQRAENRQSDRLDRVAGQPAMAFRTDLVQHHARDFHARVMGGDAAQNRRRRLRLSRNIMDHHHRPASRGGDVGRGAGAAGRVRGAVEQSHRRFGDNDVGVAAGARGETRDQAFVHRPAIEIEAFPARRRLVKRGVDIIRPAFGRADAHPAPRQGAHQAERQRCLAGARAHGGDQKAGGGHAGSPPPRGRKRRS